MNFNLTLPLLEHMTSVKLAIILWNQDNVRDFISSSFLKDQWQEVEEMVVERASKLPLPLKLKQKLLENIRPVGLNIFSWMKYHINENFVTELPAILVWTPHGVIDNKRTAELLVRDETLDIEKRYPLACMYCLVDDIRDLQGKYSGLLICKRNIQLEERYENGTFYNFLTLYWSQSLERKKTLCESFFAELFMYSANIGNAVATKYFLQKLYPPQCVDIIKLGTAENLAQRLQGSCSTLQEERFSNVLCFLLSTMNVEQQTEIVHRYTYEVLKALLFWPRESLFWEMVKGNWDLLPKDKYVSLLYNILNKMSCKHNYFSDLFGQLWQQTPVSFKEFVGDRYMGHIFVRLYIMEDEKNIQLILKDSSIPAIRSVIFHADFQNFFGYLTGNEKWDSVEYLMQKCITSEEEMIKFRDVYKLYVPLVENYIPRCNKRKQDNNSTSSKKYCCNKDIQTDTNETTQTDTN